MRWYDLVSLVSDTRIMFLLGFVFFAIIVAVTVTVLEMRVRKKRALMEIKSESESYISRVRTSLSEGGNARQKMDRLDRVVKIYFKDNFGMEENTSYSKLSEEFEKTGRVDFMNFTRKMFSAYYGHAEINENKVSTLAKNFIDLIRKKEGEHLGSKEQTINEKTSNFLKYWEDRIASFFRAIVFRWKRVQNEKITSEKAKKEAEKKRQIELENQKLLMSNEEKIKNEEENKNNIMREAEEERQKNTSIKEDKGSVSFNLKGEGLNKRVSIPSNQIGLLGDPEFLNSEGGNKKLEEFRSSKKDEDWKVVKDSFDGSLEMYPPVQKSSSSEALRKIQRT